MGIGSEDGQYFDDRFSHLVEQAKTRDPNKQLRDNQEMMDNNASGDFQSRFYATDTAPTMPPEATEKLTGAFKSTPRYDTPLAASEEPAYAAWKAQHAPNDSGEDYDLRGAFKAGVTPDANGHMPDTWKKPNHPTFSDQSMYAKDAPEKAGTWNGDRYIPPAVRSSVADDFFGTGKNDIRPSLEKFYEHAKDVFKLPGDVYAGKIDPMSQQGIEKATELATFMIGGPAPVAAKLADGTLGSFAGVTAKTIDKTKLYRAQNMELDMMHPDDIWGETGFFRGADKRWRYEVDDSSAKIKGPPDLKSSDLISIDEPRKDFFGKSKGVTRLEDILDHPELFKAYPQLAKKGVFPMPENLKRDVLGMAAQEGMYLAPMSPEKMKSVILHEAQHYIQDIEGFARGGSSEQFRRPELDKAEVFFNKVKAETEEELKGKLGRGVESYKRHIQLENADPEVFSRPWKEGEIMSPNTKRYLEWKRDHPEDHKRLKNIVDGEELLRDEAYRNAESYRRLQGEVEARNVQLRSNYFNWERQNIPPYRTEDVPRFQQHDPNNSSIGPGPRSEEPVTFRRGANDNTPGLYNSREPNMIGSDAFDDQMKAEFEAMRLRVEKTSAILDKAEKIQANPNPSEFEKAQLSKLSKEHKDLGGIETMEEGLARRADMRRIQEKSFNDYYEKYKKQTREERDIERARILEDLNPGKRMTVEDVHAEVDDLMEKGIHRNHAQNDRLAYLFKILDKLD